MPEITVGARVYFDRQKTSRVSKHASAFRGRRRTAHYLCEGLVELIERYGNGRTYATVHVIRMRLNWGDVGFAILTREECKDEEWESCDYRADRLLHRLRLRE